VTPAGCDAAYAFEDLGNAIRKIRIDLGIPIQFQAGLGIDAAHAGNGNQHAAIGIVRYSAVLFDERSRVATARWGTKFPSSVSVTQPQSLLTRPPAPQWTRERRRLGPCSPAKRRSVPNGQRRECQMRTRQLACWSASALLLAFAIGAWSYSPPTPDNGLKAIVSSSALAQADMKAHGPKPIHLRVLAQELRRLATYKGGSDVLIASAQRLEAAANRMEEVAAPVFSVSELQRRFDATSPRVRTVQNPSTDYGEYECQASIWGGSCPGDDAGGGANFSTATNGCDDLRQAADDLKALALYTCVGTGPEDPLCEAALAAETLAVVAYHQFCG